MTAQEILKRANSTYSAASEQVEDSKIGFQPILMSIDIAFNKDINKDDLASSQAQIRKTTAQSNDLGLSKTNDLGLSVPETRLTLGAGDKPFDETFFRKTAPLFQ